MKQIGFAFILLLILTLIPACQPNDHSGPPADLITNIESLGNKGQFYVSPRWSPSGDRLYLSGYKGVGLYELQLSQKVISKLDQVSPSVVSQQDLLLESDRLRLSFDRYRGQIIRDDDLEILAENAWGVRISPTGSLIAFCSGHLTNATLQVIDMSGRTVFRGPGAQAVWHPDGNRLIYSVPHAGQTTAGNVFLAGADLFMLDLKVGRPQPLTETKDIIEMQPAISEQGDRLAFIDWKTGKVFLAEIKEPGGAQ
jgi:dipeptidyl aminopeptidase/acylaminoacyl peptidase